MKERGLLLSFALSVISINFVSAQSFENFLYSIDPSLAILGSLFVLFLAIFQFSLSRMMFKGNNALSLVVSAILSFLIIYGLNTFGIDYESLFYGLGLSENLISGLGWIILLIAIIFLGKKIGFSWALMGIGGLLLALSFTEIIEYRGILFILGPILIVLGLVGLLRKKKASSVGSSSYSYSYSDPKKKGLFSKAVSGAGKGLKGTGKVSIWGAKKGWQGAKLAKEKGVLGARAAGRFARDKGIPAAKNAGRKLENWANQKVEKTARKREENYEK